ncbi:MAG: arsenite methyltransferase [Alphaproteobacteria bacterium]|nr:arsenite methyltransferase [Alphaproteobacteria bacterium]
MKCGCGNKTQDVHGAVREGYSKIAQQGGTCCGKKAPESIVTSVGYSSEELAGLPDGANMGLSCGNPTAIASLRSGEVVLDLGAGGGFDVFIAARKVGASGRAIGVDMTPDMLDKARHNVFSFINSSGLDNVEFRLGEIEHLPVADSSVDVVISNCVINLSPNKAQVWKEIARVLKPGGRVSVSDIALLKPLPAEVLESVQALVGCIAGAVLVDETRQMIRDAGLVEGVMESKANVINDMAEWSDPFYRTVMEKLPHGSKLGDYVTSMNIAATKP